MCPPILVQLIEAPGHRLGRTGVAAMLDGQFYVLREFTVYGHMPVYVPPRDEREETLLPGLCKPG